MTAKLAILRRTLAATALAGLLAACATAPEVRTQSAPGLDVAQYSTYGYVAHPGTNHGSYRSLTTIDLESAVDREMQARGYTKSMHPDLLIDFRTNVANKVQGFWGPAPYAWSWGWGGYGWGWGPGWGGGPGWGPGSWGYGGWGDVSTYSEGTLTLDVIDAKTHDAIWSASAVAPITRNTLRSPRTSISQSVASIFAKFPKAPIAAGQAH
ncbi:MAG: DUF4136 domain-containing protein [Steroidobacteraceae bacterium]